VVQKDLYTLLDIQDDDLILKTPQRQVGVLCYLKCQKTMDLVNEWYQIACYYDLLDDTPNHLPNPPNFREHRYEQAIFSLLTKNTRFSVIIQFMKLFVSIVQKWNLENQRHYYPYQIVLNRYRPFTQCCINGGYGKSVPPI